MKRLKSGLGVTSRSSFIEYTKLTLFTLSALPTRSQSTARGPGLDATCGISELDTLFAIFLRGGTAKATC